MPVGSPRERKNLSQAKVIAQLGTTSYRLACLRTTRALAALAISYSQVVNTVCKTRSKLSGNNYRRRESRRLPRLVLRRLARPRDLPVVRRLLTGLILESNQGRSPGSQ